MFSSSISSRGFLPFLSVKASLVALAFGSGWGTAGSASDNPPSREHENPSYSLLYDAISVPLGIRQLIETHLVPARHCPLEHLVPVMKKPDSPEVEAVLRPYQFFFEANAGDIRYAPVAPYGIMHDPSSGSDPAHLSFRLPFREPDQYVNAFGKNQLLIETKTSTFGGRKDPSVGRREKGALDPKGRYGSLRGFGSKSFYAAMRFPYGEKIDPDIAKAWWRNRRLLVINPENGRAVVVQPLDWGPNDEHPDTKERGLDLSPAAFEALGLETDGRAWVTWTQDSRKPGTVVKIKAPPMPTYAK